MGNKMKGIFKGFKYISNIFATKERELEIGCPTDVKHVAHIGWDGPSGNAPSWMNQFKKGPDFAAASIGHSGSALSPWTSQGSKIDLIIDQTEARGQGTEFEDSRHLSRLRPVMIEAE
ncbi:PREDICTED: CRIB domain-containing protein RIC10-like isoform X3 [Nicotiana attenuata]|uniref:CRIB domain-containing protein RIC10-like isoform X3 n=1 Tax=Nicotiana attenuata TaxID=49451 RepID=UPI000905CA7F|nr:PREDICTED: CRIB domain-containing protein RIC10-like isoform X3 [Nicotiana attenuata]